MIDNDGFEIDDEFIFVPNYDDDEYYDDIEEYYENQPPTLEELKDYFGVEN